MKFNFRELAKDEEIKCVYTGQFKGIGAFKKTVHEFLVLGESQKTHIWGSAVLNHVLYGIPFGTPVLVRYRGKEVTADSRGRLLHIYELEILAVGNLTAAPVEGELTVSKLDATISPKVEHEKEQ